GSTVFPYTARFRSIKYERTPGSRVLIEDPIKYLPVFPRQERIHHPKLDILDVVSVEIHLRRDGPGDSAEVLFRIGQQPCLGKVGIVIVHAAFMGEISQIK